MRPKGNVITLLETLMVRELSCLHLDHFVHENFALTEFFEVVIAAGDEARIYAFKNCTDMKLKDIEDIVKFGRELVERNRLQVKKNRRSAMVFLVFEDGVDYSVVKQILRNGESYKRYHYLPVIIDAKKQKIHYNIWKIPLFFLEIIWFIRKSLFSKHNKKEHKPLHIKEEHETIEKIETFRINLFNSRAYATWLLIIINIAMWILMEAHGNSHTSQTLVQFGAKVAPLIWQGEFWRLITPVFLHIGLFHLISNCVIIYILGTILESLIGRWRLLFIYLFSGLVGNMLSLHFSPFLSAGASSGVFGILGALVAYGLLYKQAIPRNFYKVIVIYLLPFILYNFILGIWYSQTDNYAHLGGLLGGILIFCLLSVEFPKPVHSKPKWVYAIFMALAFSLLYMFCMQPYPQAYRVYYYVMGETEILNDQVVEAITYFERSLEIDPNYENAHILLGKLYYRLGQVRFKEQRFDAALKYYQTAGAHIPKTRQYGKVMADVYEKIGICESGRGEDEDALRYYRKALILTPSDKRLLKVLSNQYRILARKYFEKFEYAKTIEYANKSIEMDSENLQARKLLGEAFYRQGEAMKAAGIWKEALDQLPENVLFKNILGEKVFRTYWYSGNILYKPAGVSPRAWEVNREGERILLTTGDFELARQKFQWAHAADSKFAAPLNNLAKIELMLNQKEKARYWVGESLNADPEYWEALATTAMISIYDNKTDRARGIIDECIKIKPEYAQCYGILGIICRKEGDYRKAEEYLKKALALEPENVPLRIEIAKNYYDLRDIRNFEIESNNGIGYAESQDREELSLLIRSLLRVNGEQDK